MLRFKKSLRCVVFVLGLFLWSNPLSAGEAGLVAYYNFEEGSGDIAGDLSGNHNDGKIYGAEYFNLGKGKGYALKFTGNNFVDCGNGPMLNIKDAITVEFWFNPETVLTSGEAGLVGKGRGMDSYTFSYASSCYWYINGGNNYCQARVTPGIWQHIAGTFDGKEVKVYLDGKLVNRTYSKFPAINQVDANLYLRYPVVYGGKVEPVFKCMLDEVKVYNRALSEHEVMADYYISARDKGKNVEWVGTIKIIPHLYSLAGKLLVEADYSGIIPVPEGTALKFRLLNPSGETIVREGEVAIAPQARKLEWSAETGDLPAGKYEIQVSAGNKEGQMFGKTAAVKVQLSGRPAWLNPAKGAKVMNNLVCELLNLQKLTVPPDKELAFTNPKDGWVFFSGDAGTANDNAIAVLLNLSQNKDPLFDLGSETGRMREAMRYLPAGDYVLRVHSAGKAVLNSLVVRSIPEILYAEIGYTPSIRISHYGPYNWNYLEKIGLLDNVNVIIDRGEDLSDAEHLKSWRQQGRKVLDYGNLTWLLQEIIRNEGPAFWRKRAEPITPEFAYNFWLNSRGRGLKDPGLDGIIIDEFDSNSMKDPACAPAVKLLAQNQLFRNKDFYIYCKDMLQDKDALALIQALIDGGYRFAEERYLNEMPDEAAAKELLESTLRQTMLRYQEIFPDCQKNMIMTLGAMTIPPEFLDIDPGVDWKVFMDMEFNLLANDPVFSGLYGVMSYHSSYIDEEVMRWAAKLYRHYCIEGKRERLSTDPYILSHIQNPDFDSGLSGWKLSSAEKDSITAGNVPGINRAEGRYWFQGKAPHPARLDNVLLVRRSAGAPNLISQKIINLKPGRLYSLRMFTADRDKLAKGQSGKSDLTVTVKITGADLMPDKSFKESFQSNAAGGPEMDFLRLIFRANSKTADLTISDWLSDREPGGPVGQQIVYDFIQVQPYLE